VGQEYGFVVHATGYADETTDEVAAGVAVSVGQAVMDALGAANGPSHYKVLLGYAGWGPGQLEAEIRSGAWVIAPADPAIVFDPDDSRAVWERAFARRYLDL
jgi:putative transcriptional regulator